MSLPLFLYCLISFSKRCDYTFSRWFSVTSKRISDTTARFQRCSIEVHIVQVFFRYCHVYFKIAEINFRLWKWRYRSAIEFKKYPSKIQIMQYKFRRFIVNFRPFYFQIKNITAFVAFCLYTYYIAYNCNKHYCRSNKN